MSKIIITPLGTVSPYLKGNRNCPGFLIQYNKAKILLDCGNGITRLLNFPKCLDDLNVIITHYHVDHFGDIGLLQYSSYVYHNLGYLNDKIKIYLPKNDYKFNKQAIISNTESYAEYFDITANFTVNIDDLVISFYDNKSHNIEAYMVKLQNKDFKIIYTSDIGTTNLDKVIAFCQKADLIICDSSFLVKYNLANKKHMTSYEAGMVAAKAQARKLLLTHFWPEEDKNLYLTEARQNFKYVEVAEEGKRIILRRK